MMARNRARSESRFQRWRFRGAIIPRAMPQAGMRTAPLALSRYFSLRGPERLVGQSMDQPRLHHINIDLGDVGLAQL
jgi:hypothetical protein